MKQACLLCVVGIASLLIGVGLFVFGAAPQSTELERNRIENKSDIERGQLKRRLKEWDALPESEKQDILRLHESVEQNPKSEQSLLAYTEFVSNLEPWEREQIDPGIESGQRIAEIVRLRKSQEHHGRDFRHPPWMNGTTVRRTVFPPKEFQRVLTELSKPESGGQSPVRDMAQVENQLAAFQQIVERYRAGHGEQWPSDQQTIRYLQLLPKGRFRDFLLEHERSNPERRREALAALLARTLMVNWQRELWRRVPHSEIRAVLEDLKDPREQSLTWEDPDQMQLAIVNDLERRSDNWSEFARGYRETFDLYRRLDEFSQRRPSRNGPPPRGGDFDRRREDDHRGDRRDDRRERDFSRRPPGPDHDTQRSNPDRRMPHPAPRDPRSEDGESKHDESNSEDQ